MRLRALFLILALFAPAAMADSTLTADVGWGGRTRAGRWCPIFVTVSDGKPRNAVLELHTPHDSSQAMAIRVPIAVGPVPQTYTLYAPLITSGDPTTLSLHADGKLLTDLTVIDLYGQASEDSRLGSPFISSSGPFIGVSGRGAALGSVGGAGQAEPAISYLDPHLLPRSWRGYDALDLLVLNQPDLVAMDLDQQQAIRDWVNAGGRLLLWPDDNPLPPTGPLVELLPARVGDFIQVIVPKPSLDAFNLAARFGTFPARSLKAAPGATIKHLLGGGGAEVATKAAGLGSVSLVNFNVAALVFGGDNPQPAARGFFNELVTLPQASDPGNSVQASEQANAAGQMMDLMGDVPGVGTFGFGYVAFVVLGMMAIVGPIDWFVLKWMRRQPWTWITTAGWIGLITVIALSLGSLLRSGDLHFRTVALLDQVEDHVVARTEALGLYSPRTTEYRFDVSPGSWWEPMSTDTFNYGREVVRPLPFHQDGSTNTPDEDTVRVWSLRFQLGESAGASDAVVKADLQRSVVAHHVGNKNRKAWQLRGTIANASKIALTNLWLRTDLGIFDLAQSPGFPTGGLPAGGVLNVDLTLATDTKGFAPWNEAPPQDNAIYRPNRHPIVTQAQTPLAIAKSVGELPRERGQRITDRLNGPDGDTWAVVYAETETPDGPAQLVSDNPKRRNWLVYRALIHLTEGVPSTQPH